jgi:hypothetical protein
MSFGSVVIYIELFTSKLLGNNHNLHPQDKRPTQNSLQQKQSSIL